MGSLVGDYENISGLCLPPFRKKRGKEGHPHLVDLISASHRDRASDSHRDPARKDSRAGVCKRV